MSAIVVKIEGSFDDTEFRKLETTLKRLGVQIADVDKTGVPAFERLGKKLKDVGGDMQDFGKSWSTHVTAPLAGIAAVSLKVAGDFEQTMNVLQVNAQASEKQVGKLRDMAIEFGQKTVFSAGEAADAMLELSKGGLNVAAIEGGALASTLALAATEGMGLADAATIVVQSMNTFGLSANDTAKVVDVLAAGAVASTAGVEDLAAGLKYVGSTAAQFKVGVTDSVTALAALNNAGLDSSTAGTSLNRFLLGLTGSTKKSAEGIKSLGMEFYNAKGQLKPMQEIIKELDLGMKGLTDQERIQAMKQIFGVEGMRAGNILLAEGVEGYKKLRGEIDKSGVAQEMADARMKGLKGALEQLKGSLETAAIAIGTIMAPVVQDLAKFIQGLVDKFTSLPEGVQRTIIIIGALVAAIGPAIWIIGSITSGVGSLFLQLAKLPGLFSTVASAATSLFTFLMAHPFILIAAAVVALAVIIYKNWDTIKEFLIDTFNSIKEFTLNIWNSIKDFFAKWGPTILAILAGPIGLLVKLVVDNWDSIKQTTITIFNAVKDTIVNVINAVVDFIQTPLNRIKSIFATVFNGIKDLVSDIMGGITNSIKGAINFLIRGVNTLISGMNRISISVPDWVPGIGGKSFGVSIPSIPQLAEGGIVDKPTLALIGEAGPEAVIPLRSSQGQSRVGGVTIAPGAVQINITGSVDQSSMASIDKIVNEALRRLAREVSYA